MSLGSKSQQKIALLRDRSSMLRKVRSFFYDRNVLEVDCPALNVFPVLDLYIEPMKIALGDEDIRYLHTSPEYGMKKLLAEGMGDIFQLSHVFRKEEEGGLHLNEFMMLEWYRVDFEVTDFYEEVHDLISLFLGKRGYEILTYKEALIQYAKIHPSFSKEDLLSQFPQLHREWPKDILLHYIWGTYVQPHLGKENVTLITEFPKEEASLAQTAIKGNEEVALRFEAYIQGLEIGNGFVELTDPEEHRTRFAKTNQQRKVQGKEILPIDTTFLSSLEKGLPSCIGIAIGFDRLMMLRHGKAHILDVVPFF